MNEPQPNSELRRLAGPWGGLLDPRELLTPWDKRLLHYQDVAGELVSGLRAHMYEQWKHRALYVGFVRSDKINAFAYRGAETDYVLITLGAVAKINATMAALFCCPDCFPHVGSPDGAEEPEGHFEDGFPPWPMTDVQPACVCHVPADEVRIDVAMMLADIALEFIVFHELGHVLGGHLELACGQFGPSQLSEANSPVAVSEAALHQVLELDADFFASHVDGIVTFWQGTDESWPQVFRWPDVSSRDAAIMGYTFAIGVLFRLFEGGRNHLLDMGDSHPHPAVRCNSALSWSFAWACLEQLADFGKLQEVVAEPLRMMEHLWEKFGLPGRRLAPSSAFVDQLVRLTGELKDEYDARVPLLDTYARLPAKWRGR